MLGDNVVSVVGLGYVGLPVAVAFGKVKRTVGFDINRDRIAELRRDYDRTNEVSDSDLKSADILFTSEISDLRTANFHIIAVPTPVDKANQPDLTLVLRASEIVGQALKRGDVVVYESTVYPGATEEECAPVLEKASNLKCGTDFKIGYSPERINPGDKEHSFVRITKVVAGQDEESLERISSVYGSVLTAGVHRAPNIKVAEAAKVIENTQRDINIALMNELSIIFDRLGIDTDSVLAAAGTKWNFLKFKPGLVGGHCIGVDPYYLTHKAETVGYIPQVILAGRRINDSMGRFIAQRTIKELIRAGHSMRECNVTVLGLTFKENCPDLRNSKVVDIIRELESYGISVQVSDPVADAAEAKHEYGVVLTPFNELQPASAVVLAVAHQVYREMLPADILRLVNGKPVLIDVKSVFDPALMKKNGISTWRL